VTLTQLAVDDGPHNSDGLLLHGWDGDQQVTGFVSRRVMDDWVDPRQPYRGRRSLYRGQYNALGNRNLAAIEPSHPNINEARRSIASIRLWTFCYPTSPKAARCQTRVNSFVPPKPILLRKHVHRGR
jgi:hypothetical protein